MPRRTVACKHTSRGEPARSCRSRSTCCGRTRWTSRCKFAGRPARGLRISWDAPADGAQAPSLTDAVAVLQCRPWQRYDGGDHVLQIGEVLGADLRPDEPLVFSDSRFMTTGLPMLDG